MDKFESFNKNNKQLPLKAELPQSESKQKESDDNTFLNKKRETPLTNTFQKDLHTKNEKHEKFDQDKIVQAINKEKERTQRDTEMIKNEKVRKKRRNDNE